MQAAGLWKCNEGNSLIAARYAGCRTNQVSLLLVCPTAPLLTAFGLVYVRENEHFSGRKTGGQVPTMG
jgi:hypothetical protein